MRKLKQYEIEIVFNKFITMLNNSNDEVKGEIIESEIDLSDAY